MRTFIKRSLKDGCLLLLEHGVDLRERSFESRRARHTEQSVGWMAIIFRARSGDLYCKKLKIRWKEIVKIVSTRDKNEGTRGRRTSKLGIRQRISGPSS